MAYETRDATKPKSLPYTMYINRPVGWFLAKHLLFLTPNQISLIDFGILIIALVSFFYTFGTGWVVVSYLLFTLNLILDSTDGKVSRLRGMSSKFGEWLDHSLDGLRVLLVNTTFIILLLPFVLDKNKIWLFLLFLPIITQTSYYIFASLRDLLLQQRFGFMLDQAENTRRVDIFRWIIAPIDTGVFMMITLFAFNPKYFLHLYIAYGFLYLLVIIVTSIISYRVYLNQSME